MNTIAIEHAEARDRVELLSRTNTITVFAEHVINKYIKDCEKNYGRFKGTLLYEAINR